MKNKIFGLAGMMVLVVACSEAKDPDDPTTSSSTSASSGSGAGGMGSGGDSASSSAATGGGGVGGGSGGGSAGIEGLVINEISADNDDWVELYNTTSAAISLDGVRLADDDGGMPKLDEAVDLSGALVPAGGYLFVLVKVDMPPAGEVADCSPWPSPCYQAEFGLSHGNGDTIYLVDAADNVLAQADYPADAVPADMTQTWCRVPNGSGNFAGCNATAGAANEAAN